MNSKVYLSLGSNLGERIKNIKDAIKALNNAYETKVVASSSFYETEPVGITDQPIFINAAVRIKTSLNPKRLLAEVKEIEINLGRVETYRWGPRIIDIDILIYDDIIIWEKELQIPHPEMNNRAFILIPLAEIGNQVRHPVTKKSIKEILLTILDKESVKKMETHN